jgi:hypothetical protein
MRTVLILLSSAAGCWILSASISAARADGPGKPLLITEAADPSSRDHSQNMNVQMVVSVAESRSREGERAPERCNSGEPDNGPDICAQWSAVRIARESARTGWWAMGWNVLAFFIALGSLILGLFNSRDASKQLKSADETRRKELRAYISCRHFVQEPSSEGGTGAKDIAVIWENSGNTPATEVRSTIDWCVRDGPLPEDFSFPPYPDPDVFGTLALGPGLRSTSGANPIPKADVQSIFEKKKRGFAWAAVNYLDVFGEKCRTEAAVEMKVTQLEGDLKIDFLILPRFNKIS